MPNKKKLQILSFLRSALKRKAWLLCGHLAAPATQRVGIVRSHAEPATADLRRRNEAAECLAPRSPLSAPRSGLSLTEVLIAMGILTLGLLGVAVLFPVGSFYMQKAEIADRGSAIGQAVMSDIVARGMLNPSAWYVMIPPNGPPPHSTWLASDGKYTPPPINPNRLRGTFTRPFAESLGDALKQPAAVNDGTIIGKQFGSAFVIDPIGVAMMAFPDNMSQSDWNAAASAFPATAFQVYPGTLYTASWQLWGSVWPVRRVTFQQPNTGWHMGPITAANTFQANDDLAVDLPDRDDRPAQQNWDIVVRSNGTAMPLARQWTGDYSWIVTVSPTTNAARNGMARNPEGYSYDVSVVVFYKRPLPDQAASVVTTIGSRDEYWDTIGGNERTVKASVLSTGLNGGELILGDLQDIAINGVNKSPFDELRAGEWVMLCGPHPNSTASEPRFVLNWYQVLSIDSEGTGIDRFDPTTQRVVAVRGPQWSWQPAANPGYPNAELSNNLCVGICRGAVAVHTKTIRLEGPRGSGMSLVVPPGVTPPRIGYH